MVVVVVPPSTWPPPKHVHIDVQVRASALCPKRTALIFASEKQSDWFYDAASPYPSTHEHPVERLVHPDNRPLSFDFLSLIRFGNVLRSPYAFRPNTLSWRPARHVMARALWPITVIRVQARTGPPLSPWAPFDRLCWTPWATRGPCQQMMGH